MISKIGNLFFRYRNWFFPFMLGILLYVFPAEPVGYGTFVVGWGVALLGQLLRTATVGWAYICRGGRDGAVYAESLQVEGMYKLCRNPLYLGNILILVGLLMLYGNPWMGGVTTLLVLGIYTSIVHAEEQHLLGDFGEVYERYRKRVNRWFPNPRRLPEAFEGLRFSWNRVIIREYSSLGLWIAAALLLMIYKKEFLTGPGFPGFWTKLLGVDVAFYFTARYLKKRKIITVRAPVIHQ